MKFILRLNIIIIRLEEMKLKAYIEFKIPFVMDKSINKGKIINISSINFPSNWLMHQRYIKCKDKH